MTERTLYICGGKDSALAVAALGLDLDRFEEVDLKFNEALALVNALPWSLYIGIEKAKRADFYERKIDEALRKYGTIQPFARRKEYYESTIPLLQTLLQTEHTRPAPVIPLFLPQDVLDIRARGVEKFLSVHYQRFFSGKLE